LATHAKKVKTAFEICVNSKTHSVRAQADIPLLFVLRNQLGLMSPKLGCGLGQCGACAVLVDGAVEMSCMLELGALAGRSVTTLESFAHGGKLNRIQQAFLDENAAQCGFCLSGILIRTQALLSTGRTYSDSDIKAALAPHLCRCGAHPRMLRAVRKLVGIDTEKKF
jgi:nicotinate dehydrogenase subunit A